MPVNKIQPVSSSYQITIIEPTKPITSQVPRLEIGKKYTIYLADTKLLVGRFSKYDLEYLQTIGAVDITEDDVELLRTALRNKRGRLFDNINKVTPEDLLYLKIKFA